MNPQPRRAIFLLSTLLVMAGGVEAFNPFGQARYECRYSKCDLCGKTLFDYVEIKEHSFTDNMPFGGGYNNKPVCVSTEMPNSMSFSVSQSVCMPCRRRFIDFMTDRMNRAYADTWAIMRAETESERQVNHQKELSDAEEQKRKQIEALENQLKELKR